MAARKPRTQAVAREETADKAEPAPATLASPAEQSTSATAEAPEALSAERPKPEREWVGRYPDPAGRHSVETGDGRVVRFSLGHRFKQNVIEFVPVREGAAPIASPEDREFLEQRGWKWRENETRFTKQLARSTDEDRLARARSDRAAQEDFVIMANAIRSRNGLAPIEYNLAPELFR